MSTIADKLEMSSTEVEDFLIQGSQVVMRTVAIIVNVVFSLNTQLEVMDEFFAANGSKHLLIYYEQTKEADSGTVIIKATHKETCFLTQGGKPGKTTKKIWITDGTKEAFTGLALFFIRTTSKAITTSNVAEVHETVNTIQNLLLIFF